MVFAGFSATALKARIEDAEAKLVITTDGQFRRGNAVSLKESSMRPSKEQKSVEHVLVVRRTGIDTPWTEGRDLWWHDTVDTASPEHTPEAFDAEHPLFLLYTSGTTGKPKGIMHTSGGFLTQASYTHYNVFDVKPETDVYWCTADIGWVTGHTYIVYGPLSNGVTQVVYEGTPASPDEHRHFEVIEKYGVSIYYTAPTLIRMFMKWGREIPDAHDLSSLRLLGSVGEPINPEAWRWYRDAFGGNKTPIVDTWWQTETGAIMISPLPGVTEAKPGSAMRRCPASRRRSSTRTATSWCPGADEAEHVTGYLVLDQPWPSMLRGIWGDPERYKETYWSRYAEQGWYFAGDGARVDSDGTIWLLGRIDDVMNVSGHRISTTEVESALVGHSGVAEAAVVGASDETTGQGICAFVILRHTPSTATTWSRCCASRSPRRSARSRGRAKSTSCPNSRRPAAARSCAGCCATSPRAANSATRQLWWTPACLRRSGPVSSALADGGRCTDRDESRAGPVLGDDVGQLCVERHGHRRGVQRNVLDDAGRQFFGERAVDHADQPVVDGDRCAGVARLTAHLVDEGAGLLAGSPDDAARVAGGAAQLARDIADHRVGAEAVDLKAVDVVDRARPSPGRTGSRRSRGHRCPRPSCRARRWPRRPLRPPARPDRRSARR